MSNALDVLVKQKRNLQKQKNKQDDYQDVALEKFIDDDELKTDKKRVKKNKPQYTHKENSESSAEEELKDSVKVNQKLLTDFPSKILDKKEMNNQKKNNQKISIEDDDDLANFYNSCKDKAPEQKVSEQINPKNYHNLIDLQKSEFDVPLQVAQKRPRTEIEKQPDQIKQETPKIGKMLEEATHQNDSRLEEDDYEELFKIQVAKQKTNSLKKQQMEGEKLQTQITQSNNQEDENSIDFLELQQLQMASANKKNTQTQAASQKQKIQNGTSQTQQTQQSTMSDNDLSIQFGQQSKDTIQQIMDADKSFKFYWIDIWEDTYSNQGELFLFGKVYNHINKKHENCTLWFEDYERTIYLYPSKQADIKQMESECGKIMKQHLRLSSNEWKGKIVQKKYAFEIKEVPTEMTEYYEVKYSGRVKQQLPMNLKSDLFTIALQVTQTLSEQFLIYNDIMGPCWLQIKGCKIPNQTKFKVSTKHFLQLKDNQDIAIPIENHPAPLLRVMSLALTGIINESSSQQEELLAISFVINDFVDQDGADKPNPKLLLKTMIRMPQNERWPINKIQADHNPDVKECDNENGLLGFFIAKVNEFDPDVIVGHDLYSRIINLIINRIQRGKVQSWNRMSRLQLIGQQIPKQNPQYRARALTIGRLLVDTYLASKETMKSNDLSLTFLCEQILKVDHSEIESNVSITYMHDWPSIKLLINNNSNSALHTLNVMLKLQVIPLTKQLTNICGNTWIRSLQSARAERNEMLLMHEFWRQEYILPDSNRKMKSNLDEAQIDEKYEGGKVLEPKADIYTNYILLLDFNSLYPSIIMEYNICFTNVQRQKISLLEFIKEAAPVQKVDKKKEENKKIEDSDNENDMNEEKKQSQEHNIQVGNPQDQHVIQEEEGILPKIIEFLIKQRTFAKNKMKKASGLDKEIWNIRQLAVKLVANSIYGCLGFKGSRFYAVDMAKLITSYGRTILDNSVKTVIELQYEVIYGDTDSVMINPRRTELKEVLAVGRQIKTKINSNYSKKKIVIDIDGLFRNLLLISKKRYAAIKVANLDAVLMGEEIIKEERETKGIEVVKRDYCHFAKLVLNKVVDMLLEPVDREKIFQNIINLLKEVNLILAYYSGDLPDYTEDQILDNNMFIKEKILKSSFVITKQLSQKAFNGQSSGKSHHPHVQVALRQIELGKSLDSLINHYILYIICKDQECKSVSMRARIPSEVTESNAIDYEYYKQTQIFQPIERLCKNIDGLIITDLAQAIGCKHEDKEPKLQKELIQTTMSNKEELFLKEQKYFSVCQSCDQKTTWDQFIQEEKGDDPKDKRGDKQTIKKQITYKFECKNCKKVFVLFKIKNQILLHMKSLSKPYYQGQVQCTETKVKGYCFTNELKCFGTCCVDDEDLQSKVVHVVQEGEVNINLLILQVMSTQLEESSKLEDPLFKSKKQAQLIPTVKRIFVKQPSLIMDMVSIISTLSP